MIGLRGATRALHDSPPRPRMTLGVTSGICGLLILGNDGPTDMADTPPRRSGFAATRS
jgi:hypothetical protein